MKPFYYIIVYYYEHSNMTKSRPILDIDMDHCAVDFDKGTREWRKRHPDEQFPHSHLDFWIYLDPMPGFIEAHKRLSEIFDVRFLTAPSIRNNCCWTGKAMWVQKYFGEDYLKKLTISSDKSRYSGFALVDDGVDHGQQDYRGEHLWFSHDERFTTWENVADYLINKWNENKR